MKRFLSLLALVVLPAFSWSADASMQQSQGYGDKMKSCLCMTPTNPRDESILARVDVGVDFGRLPSRIVKKDRLYDLWSINTIQPIFRADDMHNTLFGFLGVGTARWKKAAWNIGAGYRHLTASADHMFGIGVSYRHFDIRHVRFHGPQAYIEWLTQYTTLTLGRAWYDLRVSEHPAHHFLRHEHRCNATSLDLAFQFPGLPWTQVLLGRSWFQEKVGRKAFKGYKGNSFKKLDYGLRMNLLGCLALEGGYLGGWGNGAFVRLILNIGRPASNEYTLADGILGNEVFTPRDLKNYTLAPVARERIDTIAQIK
jgi:hypothetical protein